MILCLLNIYNPRKPHVFLTARIPKWWIWAYYLSPLAYGESANNVNEFLDPRWVLSLLVYIL